jgi:hypothetical protein
LGDLRNKAKKAAEQQCLREAEDRRRDGYTVFHFDFAPALTRRGLTLGEAVRYLMRATGTKVTFWRCPIRGLAVEYKKLPTTKFAYDHGETYRSLNFCALADETEAKKVLALDLVLQGIELYRGLPNKAYDDEVSRIRWLLTAPPSVPAADWLAVKDLLDLRTAPLLRTHEAELRHHLLGEEYRGPNGTVALTVRTRLEAAGGKA